MIVRFRDWRGQKTISKVRIANVLFGLDCICAPTVNN